MAGGLDDEQALAIAGHTGRPPQLPGDPTNQSQVVVEQGNASALGVGDQDAGGARGDADRRGEQLRMRVVDPTVSADAQDPAAPRIGDDQIVVVPGDAERPLEERGVGPAGQTAQEAAATEVAAGGEDLLQADAGRLAGFALLQPVVRLGLRDDREHERRRCRCAQRRRLATQRITPRRPPPVTIGSQPLRRREIDQRKPRLVVSEPPISCCRRS